MDYLEHFVRVRGTSGDEWVVKGTRVPLRTILASFAEGDSSEQIKAAFPTLEDEHLRAVVAYAAANALSGLPVESLSSRLASLLRKNRTLE